MKLHEAEEPRIFLTITLNQFVHQIKLFFQCYLDMVNGQKVCLLRMISQIFDKDHMGSLMHNNLEL